MALLDIQVELKAPKSQFNKFGGYKYRSTEDILQAVKPLLKKHGDSLELSDEPVLIGDWHYIKATATFKDHESGETTTVTGYARESASKKGMDDSQITGTASSYARKYALNGLFLIDDTKDADTDEYHQQQQPRQRQSAKRPAPKKQMTQLQKDQAEYKQLRQKIMQVTDAKMTLGEANKQIAQLAGIQNNDSDEVKGQKMVKAAREILSNYQGGNKND
ncbi:ERF family protein [Limosilactobacillus pontis]|uniref:ERF family protein n=1 Tax=Limosilactobacillus pontis TaxID=35787 RepID=A0ABU7SUP4_9LACO